MMATDQHRREERLEQFLGNLLRTGVLLSAAVVLFGGVLYLVGHGGEQPDRKTFHGEPADLRNPSGIVRNALGLKSSGVIMAGLLLLVATPVARVVFSVLGFLRERDYLYVLLTLIVLTVLPYSLAFGEIL
jgi:uncharacterized membrane protein